MLLLKHNIIFFCQPYWKTSFCALNLIESIDTGTAADGTAGAIADREPAPADPMTASLTWSEEGVRPTDVMVRKSLY